MILRDEIVLGKAGGYKEVLRGGICRWFSGFWHSVLGVSVVDVLVVEEVRGNDSHAVGLGTSHMQSEVVQNHKIFGAAISVYIHANSLNSYILGCILHCNANDIS